MNCLALKYLGVLIFDKPSFSFQGIATADPDKHEPHMAEDLPNNNNNLTDQMFLDLMHQNIELRKQIEALQKNITKLSAGMVRMIQFQYSFFILLRLTSFFSKKTGL